MERTLIVVIELLHLVKGQIRKFTFQSIDPMPQQNPFLRHHFRQTWHDSPLLDAVQAPTVRLIAVPVHPERTAHSSPVFASFFGNRAQAIDVGGQSDAKNLLRN
jgi:hypothetical protein